MRLRDIAGQDQATTLLLRAIASGRLAHALLFDGPDAETFEKASKAELKPVYLGDTMAFMFETRFVCQPTKFALETSELDHQYFECWQGLRKKFKRSGS